VPGLRRRPPSLSILASKTTLYSASAGASWRARAACYGSSLWHGFGRVVSTGPPDRDIFASSTALGRRYWRCERSHQHDERSCQSMTSSLQRSLSARWLKYRQIRRRPVPFLAGIRWPVGADHVGSAPTRTCGCPRPNRLDPRPGATRWYFLITVQGLRQRMVLVVTSSCSTSGLALSRLDALP